MNLYVNTAQAYQWSFVFRAACNALPAAVVQHWIYPYLEPPRWSPGWSWSQGARPMLFWESQAKRCHIANELAHARPVLRAASLSFTPTSLIGKYSAALASQVSSMEAHVSCRPLLLTLGNRLRGNFFHGMFPESPSDFLQRSLGHTRQRCLCGTPDRCLGHIQDPHRVYPVLMSKLTPMWKSAQEKMERMRESFNKRVHERLHGVEA